METRENFIAQVVGWENPDPNTIWKQLREHLCTVTLDRYSHHFSDDENHHKGGISGDPRGK
jgi:hypothetical protein